MPNKPKTTDLYDVATLSISNDPFIGRKRKEGSKYDAIFSQLKIGQRLVCHRHNPPRSRQRPCPAAAAARAINACRMADCRVGID